MSQIAKILRMTLASVCVLFSFFLSAEEEEWTGLPDKYVEYIQSTSGGNQYIDTGILGNTPLMAQMEMAWVALPGDGCFLGARSGGTRFYLLHYYGNWTIGYGGYFNTPLSDIARAVVGQKYTITTTLAAGEQTTTIDDKTAFARTDANTLTTDRNIYLFAMDNSGNPAYHVQAKCFSVKMWKNGELLRNFRPCIKNDEACLYDTVSETYFRNLSATPLVAGPEIADQESALLIASTPPNIGSSTPAYDETLKMMLGDTQNCAVSETTVQHEGTFYTCSGCTLETSPNGGINWENPVILTDTSYTYTYTGSFTRLTWNWTPTKVVLTLSVPSSGIAAAPRVSVEPGDFGEYDVGTRVTLTATHGTDDEWADAVFDHWEGDVPTGRDRDNPLTVTMDRPRRLVPIFRHNWMYISNTFDNITSYVIFDGYWAIRVRSDSVTTTGGLNATSPAAWELATTLDYAKPIIDPTTGNHYNIEIIEREAFNYEDYPDLANRGAASLSKIRLPTNGFRILRAKAFRGCPKLTHIEPFLPDCLVTIEEAAFAYSPVTNTLHIGFGDHEVVANQNVFWGNAFSAVEIGEQFCFPKTGEKVLPSGFFAENNSLSSFTAPSFLKKIENKAFYRCLNLQTLDLSASQVASIGSECFSDCLSLKTVKFPATALKSIAARAFYISLNSMTGALEDVDPFLPKSLEFIGDDAFCRQTRLTKPLVLGSRKHVLHLDGGWNFLGCSGLTDIIIRGGVTNLPYQVFAGCTSLERLTFGDDDRPTFVTSCVTVPTELNSCFFIPSGIASWETYVTENVTPWENLTDSERAKYTRKYGPKPANMIGLARNFAGSVNKFFLRKRPSGCLILLR